MQTAMLVPASAGSSPQSSSSSSPSSEQLPVFSQTNNNHDSNHRITLDSTMRLGGRIFRGNPFEAMTTQSAHGRINGNYNKTMNNYGATIACGASSGNFQSTVGCDPAVTSFHTTKRSISTGSLDSYDSSCSTSSSVSSYSDSSDYDDDDDDDDDPMSDTSTTNNEMNTITTDNVMITIPAGNSNNNNNSNNIKRQKKTVTVVKSNLVIKPSDYIKSAFRVHGACLDTSRRLVEPKFKAPTKEMMNAFTPELMNLVRTNNYTQLEALHRQGQLINCCNRFGESLLHLACRRGHHQIVQLLVEQANVELYIRDDYLRTPFHDACWTATPNFELLDWLIRKVPDLLIMEDVRGFTPFDYVRREDWGKWLRFLWERRMILCPHHHQQEQEQNSNYIADSGANASADATMTAPTTTFTTMMPQLPQQL